LNSLIGIGLVKERHAAISLGTSDTYFNYMKKLFYDFKGEGHVFVAPTGNYMSLICYKNGSLAREIVKNKFNLSWQEFSEILNTTAPVFLRLSHLYQILKFIGLDSMRMIWKVMLEELLRHNFFQ